MGSQNGAGSVGSWRGLCGFMEWSGLWSGLCGLTEWSGISGMGTAAFGEASLGMPTACTDLMGGSSSLRTSPGIPRYAAASSAATVDTADTSAATGGSAASSAAT